MNNWSYLRVVLFVSGYCTAFKRFMVSTYSEAVEAPRGRLEPESKRELHNVEFQTRRKDKKAGQTSLRI